MYNLFRRRLSLLLGGAIILGAALGELLTALFLFQEAMVQDILTRGPVRYLQLGVILAATIVPPAAAWKGLQTTNEESSNVDDFIKLRDYARVVEGYNEFATGCRTRYLWHDIDLVEFLARRVLGVLGA